MLRLSANAFHQYTEGHRALLSLLKLSVDPGGKAEKPQERAQM